MIISGSAPFQPGLIHNLDRAIEWVQASSRISAERVVIRLGSEDVHFASRAGGICDPQHRPKALVLLRFLDSEPGANAANVISK